jgi:hypothetical protein
MDLYMQTYIHKQTYSSIFVQVPFHPLTTLQSNKAAVDIFTAQWNEKLSTEETFFATELTSLLWRGGGGSKVISMIYGTGC